MALSDVRGAAFETGDFTVARDTIKRLSTLIADRLEELIQDATLRPGQHLVQTELARRFGVSRVAIRDALQELRRRGVAVDVPLKGTVVRPLSYKTIHELFAVRRVIEAFAARQACARMTPADLEAIASLLKRQELLKPKMGMARIVEADWRFHEAIYARCDNEAAREIIASLWARIRQARSLARVDVKWGARWSRNSIARHRKILEALCAADPDEVERLTVSAIDEALKELIEGLQAMRWGADGARIGSDGAGEFRNAAAPAISPE